MFPGAFLDLKLRACCRWLAASAALLLIGAGGANAGAAEDKPHAVFVVGTHHYAPHHTMPQLAERLESVGFRCTVISPAENPEGKKSGLPGIEALAEADVAVFYLRFLTLPDDQLKIVERYVRSGKPVVGVRTSTHAFRYPSNSPQARWNHGFGKEVVGSRYFIHLKGNTALEVTGAGKQHAVLSGIDTSKLTSAAGSLYLVDLPSTATPLVNGTGNSSRTGKVKNGFGTHELKKEMTHPVVWAWENEHGGRTFGTTLGHPLSFKDPQIVRLFINGICWAAGRHIPAVGVSMDPIVPGPPKSRPKQTATLVAQKSKPGKAPPKIVDAKNKLTGEKDPPEDPEFQQYGIYEKTAPRAANTAPRETSLPLQLRKGMRIALIGNTLFDRAQHFGHFEAMLQTAFPKLQLHVRNLAWSADTPDIQPRPDNFADTIQHLSHERADVIFAAFGFNESFQGPEGLEDYRESLSSFVSDIKSRAFNGTSAPQVVLVSPIANENTPAVGAADRNNENILAYSEATRAVAKQEGVGFIDVFRGTAEAMASPGARLTVNGCHLNDQGYRVLSELLFEGSFDRAAPTTTDQLRELIVDKNTQYFYRFRPLNTFYYTGGRSKSYGYLDFLPAMKNFDIMVSNREKAIWSLAGGVDPGPIDDSNLPPLPKTKASRGANRWISAKEELSSFQIDERFNVNLFAGEEEFPDIAAPIQMRWDAQGRLWVACSTTYPHVYPGNRPNDKLVILEDTDGDGRADRSQVFADDLHIPLSFEFGDGGVYISEEPHLTFVKDTDGDGRADYRRRVLTGFGTEDSHHSLHDFVWSPDGDLVFRESIFHHSQVETPYGPVRQQNSGWFRYRPRSERLISFGTYHSTNPWGVTYDDWGQHVASHPIYAEAHHALDPPYPKQHPKPNGLRAYSGTCGQEFVDMTSFPKEMQGGFVKVRYKPTNRVEFHRWKESEFGFDEEYVGDIIFSKNLSFIPVDLRFGPRGAMYVCDWYNPIKGHAQYSLRDPRRDRHSGRIWRITAKGHDLVQPPKIAGAALGELLDVLKRPEYRYRYWAKREIREHDPAAVAEALDQWVAALDPSDPRDLHHRLEAIWVYRSIDAVRDNLLRQLLECDDHHPRAAAVHQLRYWHEEIPEAIQLLKTACNDSNPIVRMQAAITASYVDSPESFGALLDVLNHPREGHVKYAITCALGSHTMRRYWEGNPELDIARLLRKAARDDGLKEPTPDAKGAQFDSQPNLKRVEIGCLPERMKFTVEQIAVTTGQPVKIVFKNADATDHNLLFVQPGALAEVGMAANLMAKDPRNASSDFIPQDKKHLILQASPMIGATRKTRVHVMRFNAPEKPGIYPYVCTFPGHWIVMKGQLVVAETLADVDGMVAASTPKVIRNWKMSDFGDLHLSEQPKEIQEGMNAFIKARCNQCHVVTGHGIPLGPELTKISERFKGRALLRQIIDPSAEIHKDYRTHKVLTASGDVITGLIRSETGREIVVVPNLLTPKVVRKVPANQIEFKTESKISSMPVGLLDILTQREIEQLLSYLQFSK